VRSRRRSAVVVAFERLWILRIYPPLKTTWHGIER
jgi:hypothetical protein